jgi:hypothetical protein
MEERRTSEAATPQSNTTNDYSGSEPETMGQQGGSGTIEVTRTIGTTSRIQRQLAETHAEQRIATRLAARTQGRNGWDGQNYQPTIQQTIDRQEAIAVQVRLARSRAIQRCIRNMREQRGLMIRIMTDQMGVDATAVRDWTMITDRLLVALSNTARTLEWE